MPPVSGSDVQNANRDASNHTSGSNDPGNPRLLHGAALSTLPVPLTSTRPRNNLVFCYGTFKD
ncbi:hypothetical protein DPMN_037485 [Dreissena polymorpha]|uniref:Uncharacterized protein n=1 Tax=Dreissena polymorpha TaxID=45954 RepID=A0A9D4RP76_DREPO|nr:hypothetical protein DPMN_037485 [Dreissena polymorpha]